MKGSETQPCLSETERYVEDRGMTHQIADGRSTETHILAGWVSGPIFVMTPLSNISLLESDELVLSLKNPRRADQ